MTSGPGTADRRVHFDVVGVGGGMAGMSVASELARTRSVAVLEQEPELGRHATGRSAAALLESYGSPEIRALTRASRRLLQEAPDTAGVLTPRPLVWIGDSAQEGAVADLVADRPGLRPISAADARATCPVLRVGAVAAAALDTGAHDIDVAALLQAYVARSSAAGVCVHPRCRLERAERADGRWLLHHAAGTVAADVVVDAAGAWGDHVAAILGARPRGLRPLRRTIAVARTPRQVQATWPLVAALVVEDPAPTTLVDGLDLAALSPARDGLVLPA